MLRYFIHCSRRQFTTKARSYIKGDAEVQQPLNLYEKPDITRSTAKGNVLPADFGSGSKLGLGDNSAAVWDPELKSWRIYSCGHNGIVMGMKMFSICSFLGYQFIIPSAMHYAFMNEVGTASTAEIIGCGCLAWGLTSASTFLFLKYSARYVLDLYLKPNEKARQQSSSSPLGPRSMDQKLLPDWLVPHPEDSVLIRVPDFLPRSRLLEIPLSQLKLSLGVPFSTYKWVEKDDDVDGERQEPAAAPKRYFMVNTAKVHFLPLQPLHEFILNQLKKTPLLSKEASEESLKLKDGKDSVRQLVKE